MGKLASSAFSPERGGPLARCCALLRFSGELDGTKRVSAMRLRAVRSRLMPRASCSRDEEAAAGDKENHASPIGVWAQPCTVCLKKGMFGLDVIALHLSMMLS